MVFRPGNSSDFKFFHVDGRQHNINHTDFLDLFKDPSRFITQTGIFTHKAECFPKHKRKETYENMCLYTIIFLMPEWTKMQIRFMDSERFLRISQMDIRFPQVFCFPVGDIRAEEIMS